MSGKSTSFLASGLAMLAFAALPGAASAWEYAYGPAATSEQAFRRVMPVDCPAYGPGFIAIGTVSQDGFDPNVYVVYTDLTGARRWELSFDVQDLNFPDEGIAIAQLPEGEGFVFLSNSLDGVWSPALTQISCAGRLTWSRLYPDLNGHNLQGRDLIRTANGQLAVAGVGAMGLGDDAFLMRTNPAGVPVWNFYYDAGGEEAFNALTEAPRRVGQLAGDLVAVGRFNDFGSDLQGLVARVDGATGAIGAFPQCWAQYGQAGDDEVYNSVIPLTTPPYAGQFAMVGTANGGLLQEDVWLTRGNPCQPALSSRVGNPGGDPTQEEGFDLREAADPVVGPAGGLLAVAGAHGNGFGAPYDAVFLQVATATLLPFGGASRLFGDHGFRHEVFYSLEADPAGWPQGYIFAGYTERDWEGLGDPRDLYLVQHSPLAPAACEQEWSPDGFNYEETELELLLGQGYAVDNFSVPAPVSKLDTAFPVCP